MNWARRNGRSLVALCWHLPRYLIGDWKPRRLRMKRTLATLRFGWEAWRGIDRWCAPWLEVSVMDGMGEHYGYPRHKAWIVIWWNRRGYAFGVDFSVPSETASDGL